jgi:hypothetical protein
MTLSTLPCGFLGGIFLGATSQEHVLHLLKIPFVACILVNPVLSLFEAKHRRPWLDPGGRILHGYLVTDLIRGNPREVFHQMQIFG